MKLSSLGYLIKEGFRSIKQNGFMSIASVLVLISCLLLSGASYLVLINVEAGFDYAYEQNKAIVWAVENADDQQLQVLETQLRSNNNIQDVVFRSKEETLESYQNIVGDATFENLQGADNPMLDGFEITFVDQLLFDETIAQIETMEFVDDVSYAKDVADILVNIRQAVLTIALWIILMLLLVSLFIISNTIKLTVYSRRLEIGIMKSVGATKAFIRFPFMIEGMVLGFTAGLLAFGILYFVYTHLISVVVLGFIQFASLSSVGMLGVMPVWAELLISFLLIGTLTGMFGSRHAIGRYLKEESGVNID